MNIVKYKVYHLILGKFRTPLKNVFIVLHSSQSFSINELCKLLQNKLLKCYIGAQILLCSNLDT